MKRRSFFGTLLALVTAPFVAKAVVPINLDEQFSVDMDWGNWDISRYPFRDITPAHIEEFKDRHPHLWSADELRAREAARRPMYHHLSPAIDPWPLKPFCEFDAPIEAMQTVTSTAGDELLLVTAGGIGYVVDQHGVATRL